MRAILHDVTVSDDEQDELQDCEAQPLVCFTELAYWKFWIWLYGRMRERVG